MKTPLRFYSILKRSALANFGRSSDSNQVTIASKSLERSTFLRTISIAVSNFAMTVESAFSMQQTHYNINYRVFKADPFQVVNRIARLLRLFNNQGFFSFRISEMSQKLIYD